MKNLFISLLMLCSLTATAQERTDTVIPKVLCNGYFFRDMKNLPYSSSFSIHRLKDNEDNSIIAVDINGALPESIIQQAIPREQVHNADQFLKGINMLHEMEEQTRGKTKRHDTLYYPEVGKLFPNFREKDVDGRIWTNDSVRGHVMVLNLWYSGCGPCRAEMPELSTWKEKFPDVTFLSATFHKTEQVKNITEKQHFTWTHLVEAKDMMPWIGNKGFPLTIVVDKHGIVRHIVHGTSEGDRAQILTKIKEANAE